MPYQYISGVWDGKKRFLKVAAICWFHRQSHGRGQEGLSLIVEDQLQPHCVDDIYDPDETERKCYCPQSQLIYLRPAPGHTMRNMWSGE